MMDAVNVIVLRPKVFVLPLATVKKELGETLASTTNENFYFFKKKVILPSDYEQTTSEGSASQPLTLPRKKKP